MTSVNGSHLFVVLGINCVSQAKTNHNSTLQSPCPQKIHQRRALSFIEASIARLTPFQERDDTSFQFFLLDGMVAYVGANGRLASVANTQVGMQVMDGRATWR